MKAKTWIPKTRQNRRRILQRAEKTKKSNKKKQSPAQMAESPTRHSASGFHPSPVPLLQNPEATSASSSTPEDENSPWKEVTTGRSKKRRPRVNENANSADQRRHTQSQEKSLSRSEEKVLIVNGIPEKEIEDVEQLRQNDVAFIKECTEVIDEEGKSITVLDAYRLGQNRTDGRPRPLKVHLKSKVEREIFLKLKKELTEAFPGNYFQRHFSSTERKKHQDLKDQLTALENRGYFNFVIRNGRLMKLRPPPVMMTCSQSIL